MILVAFPFLPFCFSILPTFAAVTARTRMQRQLDVPRLTRTEVQPGRVQVAGVELCPVRGACACSVRILYCASIAFTNFSPLFWYLAFARLLSRSGLAPLDDRMRW